MPYIPHFLSFQKISLRQNNASRFYLVLGEILDGPKWMEFCSVALHQELILFSVALSASFQLTVNTATSSA